MKKILFLNLLFLAALADCKAQDDMYVKCFERYITHYYHGSMTFVYIRNSIGITEYIPTTVANVKIIALNDNELKGMVKKKGIVVSQVFPIIIRDGKMNLEIVEFSVVKRKGQLSFTRHGGSTFEIGYLDEQYVITNEEHRGI